MFDTATTRPDLKGKKESQTVIASFADIDFLSCYAGVGWDAWGKKKSILKGQLPNRRD